jgi:hypothetical protein
MGGKSTFYSVDTIIPDCLYLKTSSARTAMFLPFYDSGRSHGKQTANSEGDSPQGRRERKGQNGFEFGLGLMAANGER